MTQSSSSNRSPLIFTLIGACWDGLARYFFDRDLLCPRPTWNAHGDAHFLRLGCFPFRCGSRGALSGAVHLVST